MTTIKKSGTNLMLELSAETYDNTYCGQATTVAPPNQTPLVGQSVPCFGVLVQMSQANNQGTVVYVGNEHQGCFVELTPGNSIIIPINDLEKVYIRGSEDGLIVPYLAMI